MNPSLEILVRGSEGFSIWNGPPFTNNQPAVKLDAVTCNSATFSEDGSTLMVIKPDSVVTLYETASFKERRSLQVPNLIAASLSPRGSFVLTFQKALTPHDKNVVLWKVDSGGAVYNLLQKNTTKTTWPTIRLSSDESVACRMATNEIQFFDPSDFSKGIVSRLRVPGVAGIELSMVPGSHVAAFVPEAKGSPDIFLWKRSANSAYCSAELFPMFYSATEVESWFRWPSSCGAVRC